MMQAMGTLYLVRHGQASFGAADYDQLSALGREQCVCLGRYWQQRGINFEAVLTGSLKRHQQSLAGIAEGLATPYQPLVWPELNEYDSEALIEAIHPEPLARPDSPELYRHHFRQLREGLKAWMRGDTQPRGMTSYAEFSAGVAAALDHVLKNCSGNVLIVSSGGPISTALSPRRSSPRCELSRRMPRRRIGPSSTSTSYARSRTQISGLWSAVTSWPGFATSSSERSFAKTTSPAR